MSDHHMVQRQPTLGEVEHVNFLSENIGALFMKEDYSDITLRIENQRFHAHKVILASRSEYFRALLYGGLRESRPECSEVELKDTTAGAFSLLLKYIYTGKMNLRDLKEERLLDVLALSHQYGFTDLEASISDYLKAILNTRNVCLVYDIASIYSQASLSATCCDFMDRNAREILQGEAFMSMSAQALQEVLSRDSFCAPEVDIFRAVTAWAERNHEEEFKAVMGVVRLPLMSLEDLLNNVRQSRLVTPDSILDAIKLKNESRDMELRYRGLMVPEQNIGTLRHGAQVIQGEMKAALLDGDSQNYDLDRGFTRHPVDDNNGQGIVIRLGQPYIINTIRMLLWDRDMRSYSYYIEVSMDEKDWVKIVDYTRYLCRSWQNLRFPATVVRFVRVVGTHNTVNRVFHLVSFEAMYSRSTFQAEAGILVPTENVATIDASACVIEGVSRSRNALINGDTKNYDWDSGYTCHQLGSGAIVVQLAQPYIIGSIRLLLWDCDGRTYSYYVEVSTDQLRWTRVVDKTKEACRSWQTITFEKQAMTFVKIVGTHNTANEVFHCVHFECPASAPSLAESGQPCDTGVEMAPSPRLKQVAMERPGRPQDAGSLLTLERERTAAAAAAAANAGGPGGAAGGLLVNLGGMGNMPLGLALLNLPPLPVHPLQNQHHPPNRPDVMDDNMDGMAEAGEGAVGGAVGGGAAGNDNSPEMGDHNRHALALAEDRADGYGLPGALDVPGQHRGSDSDRSNSPALSS